jgi:anti-sigma28 factor (negative regulator of flagellin synthesis)
MQQHPGDILRGPVRPSRCDRSDPANRDIRWALVDRIRQEIALGTYDTDEKLEKALERLLDEVDKPG